MLAKGYKGHKVNFNYHNVSTIIGWVNHRVLLPFTKRASTL